MKFTYSHEWIVLEDANIVCIGITDYAQKELGTITYVELPQIGSHVEKGQAAVIVESCKAATDIYSPVSGKVVKINEKLREHPELLNIKSEEEGWLFCVQLYAFHESDSLMDKDQYIKWLKQ